MLEAIEACERIADRGSSGSSATTPASATTAGGSATSARSQRDYPGWKLTEGIESILQQIHDVNAERWVSAPA